MKPRETKNESMQRVESQSPLRCSSPASSETPPDHCGKVVEKGGQGQLTRVVLRRRFGARVSLNGGELDKEPSLNSVSQQGDINAKEAG